MHTSFEHLKAMDDRAVRHSLDLVAGITDQDLSRPTPCSAWTLGDLLAHMTVQHRGFAAAARGAGSDLALWASHPLGADALGQYVSAAEDLLVAFAAVQDADAGFALPELTTAQLFPAATAIGFHCIDYVVHSWDVAATLGVAFDPDQELLDAALPIAMAVPNGPRRLDPKSSFAPALTSPGGAGTLEVILALLGRSPDWRSGI